jgi:CHAD domain-containing protein
MEMAKRRDIPLGKNGTDPKEIAAAAALVSAAAVGGKVALKMHATARRDSERAFRLYKDEPTPDGVRRIARGQLDEARDGLAETRKRKLARAVHESRKGLKRLRTALRLARDALGEETYKRENTAFRDAGRRLAGVRDASVLIETLDALQQTSGDDLPGGHTANLRARLKDERKQALESLKTDDRLPAALDDLDSARTRTAAWNFDVDGFAALEPGLRRIYRRGRKAMRRAQAEPTSENLHEWRKRVKDLWHAEQMLRPASPKKMKRLAKRTHRLADLLGDDHDLAELRGYVATHRGCFADRDSQAALTVVIDRRREVLQRQAFSLGPSLYDPSPKKFVRGIRRGWRKRSRPPTAAAR